MNAANIETGWHGSGTANDPYRPAVADDHQLKTWRANSSADPKLGGTYTITVWCDNNTLAAINADPKYSGKITALN